MRKKILIISSIIAIIIFAFILIIKNYNKSIKEELEIYDTVSDEEENKFDSIDYHYYVTLIKYEKYNVKKNATREEREKIYYYYENEREAVFELCRKNGEWEYILFADTWGEYNKKDGLLGDFNFDKLKKVDINNKEYGGYIYVEANNNKVKRLYHIYWEGFFQFNVDLISEENLLTNEIKILNIKYFTKENIEQNFIKLCKQGMEYPDHYEFNGTYYGDNIALSNNFKDKYPYFLDLFIHYSPLEYNKVTLLDLDINKKKVKFEVDSLLECKKRTYDCEYKLTEDLQLDDMRVSILKEEETEAKLNTMNRAHTFYKYTDWVKYKDLINYTEKFYNKFKENCSYFPDIDSIENNFVFDEPYHQSIKVWDNKIGTIGKYLTINGEYYFYFIKFFYDKNNKLDDVFCKKLPYTNISIEEAKERFLADTELQKELGIN
ncbi:MAG: hypothetical protein Q4F88_05130 [Eubacteriales bacterium]|nr:hypothetical protein [Eubacteriales bacterium]